MGSKIGGKAYPVMRTGYHLELDVSPVLKNNQEKYYQSLIAVLRCAVEVVRIDIHVEGTLIYCYLAQSQK